jgi:hypothetical protein
MATCRTIAEVVSLAGGRGVAQEDDRKATLRSVRPRVITDSSAAHPLRVRSTGLMRRTLALPEITFSR